MSDASSEFLALLSEAAEIGVPFKAVLSKPRENGSVKKITYSPYKSKSGVLIKEESLAGNGKMISKNYTPDELCSRVSDNLLHFMQGNITVGDASAQYMISKKGREGFIGGSSVRKILQSGSLSLENTAHNRQKNYFFDGSEKWLYELGISDHDGRIHDKKRAKFREIERFTELLDDVYSKLPSTGRLNVCDLCCGKSYLSFAIYEYLTAVKKREVRMLCADLKADVINFCADAAMRIGCEGMIFKSGDVSENVIYDDAFGGEKVHLVVSLHACDTATDIVLRRAVKLDADLILSTPCCHHYLNGRLTGCRELSFITSHSMLSQKLTDAVTDGLRAKMLEIEGYSVETVELIDPEETPKNVMIRASKKKSRIGREVLLREYNDIVSFFKLEGSYYDIYSSFSSSSPSQS